MLQVPILSFKTMVPAAEQGNMAARQSEWHIAGKRGKHKHKGRAASDRQSRSVCLEQPATGLASLPSTIISLIYQHLQTTPAAAVKLSQTCCTCAAEFAIHRSSFIKQHCRQLCPTYSVSRMTLYTVHCPQITVSWAQASAMRQLYFLSREPGALKGMWIAAFADLRENLAFQGYQAKPLHAYQAARRRRLSHAFPDVDILLKSDQPFCISSQWLQDTFLATAVAALQDVLSEQHCYLRIHVSLYRCDRWGQNTNILDTISRCQDEVSDLESQLSEFIYTEFDPRDPEPIVALLPFSKQTLVITGDWYLGEDAGKGQVPGDQLIDLQQLNQDFCTWQSYDSDLWMYTPFTCEIANEPKWFYK